MKLKRLFAAVLAAVSMLTMGMMLSGCGGSGDSKEDAASASYTTQDEAVQAATKESQEVVKQIEAREGKVVVIWRIPPRMPAYRSRWDWSRRTARAGR